MRKWLMVTVAFLLIVDLFSSSACAASSMGDGLEVDWDPRSLNLRPGQTGKIRITIVNHGEEAQVLGLDYPGIECPGGSSGTITSSFFTLGPGESRKIVVEVTSHARFLQEACTSDAHIEVEWGRNLTRDPNGHIDRDTVEGSYDIDVHVWDDFGILRIVLISVVATVIVFAIVKLRKRRLRQMEDAGHQG